MNISDNEKGTLPITLKRKLPASPPAKQSKKKPVSSPQHQQMYTAEKVQENLSNSSSNISYEHSSSLHNIQIEMSSLPSADSKTRQIYIPEHHIIYTA